MQSEVLCHCHLLDMSNHLGSAIQEDKGTDVSIEPVLVDSLSIRLPFLYSCLIRIRLRNVVLNDQQVMSLQHRLHHDFPDAKIVPIIVHLLGMLAELTSSGPRILASCSLRLFQPELPGPVKGVVSVTTQRSVRSNA